MASDLTAILARLRACEWVDLTHAFRPGIPHYAAFPDEQRSVVFGFREGEGSAGSGFLAHEYRHIGQWGTHMDPPVHFVEGGRTQDAIPVTDMVCALVVLDVRDAVRRDPDFAATADSVRADEAEHGRVPEGAFVALHTGWGERWPDGEAMRNGGRSPGWDASAIDLLVSDRAITAIGHDTTDTDPGARVAAGDVAAETAILAADRWQIELLASLDRVPPRGALIVATWPKPEGGSGFPARCFALVDR